MRLHPLNGMAVKRVHLKESWVYGRAGLQAGEADTVQSLNLQGTYREKIISLGDAFRNFKSLRSLDLSRNLIISLRGIEYLHALRSLNLYYNDIEALEEIARLRPLSLLKTLDLRLNPVTRQDADYRLIIIHAIGTLETLDERPVRESERKNAKFNFRLKDYKTKEIPEVEIGSTGSSYTQKTSAKTHLDFDMSDAEFGKVNGRENERTDYMKKISPSKYINDQENERTDYMKKISPSKYISDQENERTDYMKKISPSKYQTNEHQSYVPPQSDFEDEYRPLPSPTRSSLRSPVSRVKEGHRVTFAESAISELFPKKEDLSRRSESDDNLACAGKHTSDTPTSGLSYKNTYLTSTPVRKEAASSERARVDGGVFSGIGQSTEFRDHLKSAEESSRDRLLRLSSDLYVTTHLTDPPASSNSLSALRKGFTDVSKTYALPSKPALANTHLSTGKSASRQEFNRDYKNAWNLDRPSATKFDSLTAPQNGLKRASSLNSLLSPTVSSSDDLLSGNELKTRVGSGSSEAPSVNDVLHQLMDLVDRYWNGSGSLLQNHRFLVPARDLLSRLMSARQTVDSTVSHRRDEDGETPDSVKLKLVKVMEENHFLRTKVYKLENQAARNEGSAASSLPQEDLRQKYEQLSLQVESLQQQLEKTNKLQETVHLLHNSQRSLVCTNEYLLKQLQKISPNTISRPPRGTSPDRTGMQRYLYSEPGEPSAPTYHSSGHYRTPERLSLCPL